MVTALGITAGLACVAWTTFEVIGLLRTATVSGRPAPREARAQRVRFAPGSPERPGRFAAWDDRGRPITVEDLGPN